jgi:hypothetical protein
LAKEESQYVAYGLAWVEAESNIDIEASRDLVSVDADIEGEISRKLGPALWLGESMVALCQ